MSLSTLTKEIETCTACPRLRRHCEAVAQKKKLQYQSQTYWGKPVAGFGDLNASIWILGLAPAAHGANRTGRMFTGDSSGNWLYRALFETGFANQSRSDSRDDGMKLSEIYISAAARCAPPDNKPSPSELKKCFGFLEKEWDLLTNVTTILALGKIAHDCALDLFESHGIELRRKNYPFKHHGDFEIGGKRLISSYHPSRQNTQTGRLTWKMWEEVFIDLKNHSSSKRKLVRPLKSNIFQVPLSSR